MKREQVAVALFVLSALSVMGVSALTKGQADVSQTLSKTVGFSGVAAGMLLAGWAVRSAGGALRGAVNPVLDRIVTEGPYRLIRHPMYLGFLIALVGVAVLAQSWIGLGSVFAVFLPAVTFRGRLEERALSTRFGDAWSRYADRTSFIFPLVW